jgi:hypothetical protein
VGNGNSDVGNKNPPSKPGQPVENLVKRVGSSGQRIEPSKPVKRQPPRTSGAMSQQSCDSGHGNVSAPQKFVRLVGCREPNAHPDAWVRPGPIKR